jgi:tetratricopeptide (TPR) repeat protein
MNSLSPFDENLARAQAQGFLRAGKWSELEHLSSLGLQHAPQAEHWLAWQAHAFSMQQKPLQALPIYQQLTELQPRLAQHWSNYANALCELGRERDALIPAQKAYVIGARDAGVHFALARAQSAHGELNQAMAAINAAIELDPNDVEFRILRARLLSALDDWPGANQEMDRLQALALSPEQKTDLAYIFLQCGFYQDALQAFNADEGNLDAILGRVLCLERLNRLEEAVALREKIAPEIKTLSDKKLIQKTWQVDAKLAARAKNFQAAAMHLQQLLSTEMNDRTLSFSLKFDLAAAQDKCSDVFEAMQTLAAAHREKRKFVQHHHPELRRNDNILAVLEQTPVAAKAFSKANDKDKKTDPIFVVGFPRSGTTLLEQLLDAHHQLDSFDEQPFLQRRLQALVAKHTNLNDALLQLSEKEIAELRIDYFNDVSKSLPSPKGTHIVDKNPLNLVRMNLAQALFPHSKIILALRHPCDVVLSCYMQNFRALAFAFTFETIESTARMYNQVFSHWLQQQAILELPVHTVRYEDLVGNVETHARKVFGYLDLPWQDNLLQFTERAKTKGAISTPSYTQVIEGVNQRAVGRWQPYKKYFTDDAMASLAPWIERFGYTV